MSTPGSPFGASPTDLRLYLLRHAKSSWTDADLADHDRPLAGRGRRAADAIADHMRAEAIAPELVLCSTARRARETYERIEPALAAAPVRYEAGLYGASAMSLLERLRGLPDDVDSVLLVGHNPAIEELAVALARPSPRRRDLEVKFPTGALATLTGPLPSWRGLDHDSVELVAFVRPRDL
jgi:phosphohistidine phosphatase